MTGLEGSRLQTWDWAGACPIADLLVRAAVNEPQHEAVVFPDVGVSYHEFLAGALRMARGLLNLGVDRGDHVGILMPNSCDFLYSLFGASMLGAVAVPINSRFRKAELRYIIQNSNMKVVVVSDLMLDHVDFAARLTQAFPEISSASDATKLDLSAVPSVRAFVQLANRGDQPGFVDCDRFEELANGVPVSAVERRREQVCIRDPAMLIYTSGTTAHPKGCVHTHESLVRTGIVTGRTRLRLTLGDRVWNPLPMFHVGFLLPMIAVIDACGTMLTMPHFDGGVALDMIVRGEATILYPSFPVIAKALIDHPSFSKRDIGRVRMIMCVAAPKVLEVIQEALPYGILVSTYGSTEVGFATFSLPTDTLMQRTATCGPPIRGVEIAVRDPDTGNFCCVGEAGEILIRGFSVFEGYYAAPAETVEAFDIDHWFHTGDLGSVDEAGYLTFRGRLKDVLKIGGENVSPAEVEEVIGQCPGVRWVQVVGVPDDRLGEVGAAFVELLPGKVGLTEEDVIDYCRARIAGFKVPRYVRFVDCWPMSATKIRKEELRSRIISELGLILH